MKTTIEVKGQLESSAKSNFSQSCINSCRKLLTQLENVKTQIVAEFRDQLEGHQHVLELAINEAEALAWQTDYPELLFPTLATEKASAVTGWHLRQQSLRRRTAPAFIMA
ncbi:MAG TPA: hypothetical protein VH597_06645 [Verrucomicrobiae bacterium]|jgi:hypothetical protein|nr:hypothetical protein [Verrucomicrobiae bacterium]